MSVLKKRCFYATIRRFSEYDKSKRGCCLKKPSHKSTSHVGKIKPTVCLCVTYVVVYTYGFDNDRIWPPRCAVIVAALGDRCRPHPACSIPPAEAGSARSALAVGSGPVSTADLGGSRQSGTTPPSGTTPCGDASLA